MSVRSPGTSEFDPSVLRVWKEGSKRENAVTTTEREQFEPVLDPEGATDGGCLVIPQRRMIPCLEVVVTRRSDRSRRRVGQ